MNNTDSEPGQPGTPILNTYRFDDSYLHNSNFSDIILRYSQGWQV